mgnify:CR=1 FL=1
MTTNETLLKLMCLPISKFVGVVRTADGHYLAQVHGGLGYNAFLGRPTAPHAGPGRDYMLATWNSLTSSEKLAVLALAANPIDGSPILLSEDFGVPVTDL